jgi:adenine-specific DNA-methyltransferase
MDFFAGSGTTGHATLALNSEDGGQRRFILITNNESDICRRVTVPRVRAAMERCGIYAASLEIQLS